MRLCLAMAALLVLTACAGLQSGPLPPAQRAAVAYAASGPPSLTLITVINNRSGDGGHTALMVSGSQRVIFDPAGTFSSPSVVEHGDVLYGVTPSVYAAYRSKHARESHHVVEQEIIVAPELAERALALVEANGTVASAFCASATSRILQQLPGFAGVGSYLYPEKLMQDFARVPGVREVRYFENDAGQQVSGPAALGLSH